LSASGSRAIDVSTVPRSIWGIPVLIAAAVLLEVTVMPYIVIGDAVPDLLAPTIVAIGMLRGSLTGAIAGMVGGLLIELAAPTGTLGVLGLLYLGVGAFAGRYHGRDEATQLIPPIIVAVAAAGAVELGYGVIQGLLGNGLGPAALVGRVILPGMALTLLLSPPVLLVARRLLGPGVPDEGAVA